MSLVLENVSFSQELNDTFQQPTELSFEVRKKIRNSRRGKSKALLLADRRINRTLRATKKARTAKRKLMRSIR